MQRLSICIDIDGTVTDPYYWLSRANKHFGTRIKPDDVDCYQMHEVLGIEASAYEEFYDTFGAMMHLEANVRKGAQEVISELYQTHYVHFVTARKESMEFVSVDWLYRHKIPFDSLSLLGTPDKVARVRELEGDFVIEDCYDNAIQLAKAGYSVLLIDCSYNQGPIPHGITRVYNWYHIKAAILRSMEREAS